MDFDAGQIFYSDQTEQGLGGQSDSLSPIAARLKYKEFIRTFRLEDDHVYRQHADKRSCHGSQGSCLPRGQGYRGRGAIAGRDVGVREWDGHSDDLDLTPLPCPCVCRDMLRSAIGTKNHLMEIDIDHLLMFDDKLANDLLERPSFHLPLFEQARALSLAPTRPLHDLLAACCGTCLPATYLSLGLRDVQAALRASPR